MTNGPGAHQRVPARMLRFLATGVLNTAFGYAVYAALLYAGAGYLPALFAATVLGVCFNQLTFGRLVFRDRTSAGTMPRFVAAYAATYAANAGMLHVAVQGWGWNAYAAQAACLPPTVAFSWLLLNHWVFRK